MGGGVDHVNPPGAGLAVFPPGESGMIGSAWRWRWVLKRTLNLVVAGGLVWGVWRGWEVRRDRTVLAEVQKDVQAGRYEAAARQLTALLDQRPDWDEAAYLLGLYENARGRSDAASAAWARVRPGSAFIAPAILGRAELMTRRGRQADAEQLIERVLGDPRIEGSSLRWFLVPFYWQEGRVEEAERLLEADWDHLNRSSGGFLDQTMNLVQAHMRLARGEDPDPGFRRAVLRQAEQMAPEDDRVWLAKANLAISQGAFDEAARWLNSCLQRRPEDVPVWQAYLRWAMATNRVAEVQKALRHIPADATTPAQVDRLAVWLAAHVGDVASERRALERLVADAPDDLSAWERRAELAGVAVQPAYAAELRRKKTELDQAKERYQECYRRNQPLRDAAEMARLAEQLGRWFEARVFLTIAALVEPHHDKFPEELARLNRREVVDAQPGLTLAELLARDLDAGAGSPPLSGTPAAARAAATPSL
jgi:enediyne biosynthesis protein E4